MTSRQQAAVMDWSIRSLGLSRYLANCNARRAASVAMATMDLRLLKKERKGRATSQPPVARRLSAGSQVSRQVTAEGVARALGFGQGAAMGISMSDAIADGTVRRMMKDVFVKRMTGGAR